MQIRSYSSSGRCGSLPFLVELFGRVTLLMHGSAGLKVSKLPHAPFPAAAASPSSPKWCNAMTQFTAKSAAAIMHARTTHRPCFARNAEQPQQRHCRYNGESSPARHSDKWRGEGEQLLALVLARRNDRPATTCVTDSPRVDSVESSSVD